LEPVTPPKAFDSGSSLPALDGAVTLYDRDTAEHSARVAYASAALARRLGLEDQEMQTVWWAATLHDLGKLGVPVEVVRKVGPLDEAEWSEMRRHPIVGGDLLLAISPSLAPIAAAVRAHHERWDGLGYPDQLAGEDIPLLGRLIAIADTFDSMTRSRPYRRDVFAAADAIGELQRQSGSQFDPCLVPLFVELHNEGQIVPR
jgi:HD-GYP domain-containing protein (c-di-GMP phosphodiesterase class II)